VDIVAEINAELARRRSVNHRYSLRALARSLGTSHSLLSRLCHRGRRPSPSTIAALGARLGWTAARIDEATRAERVDRLCARAAQRGFDTDVRWLATRLGMSMDDVQVALHEAVRTGRLTMSSRRRWIREG
jgi:transcriptional regulator with XRE-family HTH domain